MQPTWVLLYPSVSEEWGVLRFLSPAFLSFSCLCCWQARRWIKVDCCDHLQPLRWLTGGLEGSFSITLELSQQSTSAPPQWDWFLIQEISGARSAPSSSGQNVKETKAELVFSVGSALLYLAQSPRKVIQIGPMAYGKGITALQPKSRVAGHRFRFPLDNNLCIAAHQVRFRVAPIRWSTCSMLSSVTPSWRNTEEKTVPKVPEPLESTTWQAGTFLEVD